MDEFDFLNSRAIVNDMADLLIGARLGEGIARQVFGCKIDRTLVVKIEKTGGSFQNIKEWELWESVQYVKEISRWLAPCINISACGTILLQKRVIPAYKKDFPERVPAFLTDLKSENYGMLDGRFVCFDYGSLLVGSSMRSGYKKAHWNHV